jgi:hypothetical protein
VSTVCCGHLRQKGWPLYLYIVLLGVRMADRVLSSAWSSLKPPMSHAVMWPEIETGARGNAVVKVLCYKPEGRGFQTRRAELFFSIYLILPAALGPEVYSACSRNEYQKQKNNVPGE